MEPCDKMCVDGHGTCTGYPIHPQQGDDLKFLCHANSSMLTKVQVRDSSKWRLTERGNDEALMSHCKEHAAYTPQQYPSNPRPL